MRPRTLVILVVLGIAALGGGWYFGTATTPAEHTTIASGSLMFPNLAARLQDATKVEITHQGKQLVIEKRSDGSWGVASMRDYPVQETKLRGMLTALTELRLAEPRTSEPSEFPRLGVDNPNGATSSADLLRVVDAAGKPILALIVGHRRVLTQGNVPDEVYVRRPDQNQSWLARGSLQVDADASLWLDRNVLNIPQTRVARVVVGDKALVFGRVDGRFALTQPADHPKLADYKVDDVGRALEQLTFQAVKADADAPGTDAGHAVFTTTDGLAVSVTLRHDSKDIWARFAVAAPPGGIGVEAAQTAQLKAAQTGATATAAGTGKAGTATDQAPEMASAKNAGGVAAKNAARVTAEAHRLNARLAGWTYQIGSWKEQSLVPTLDDLKAPEPAKAAPAPAASAASPSAASPSAFSASAPAASAAPAAAAAK